MPHGAADYTKMTSAKVVAAKVDFDLPVIMIDRFDSANFQWTAAGTAADYDAGMEAGAAYEGNTGLALRTSLTAAAAGEFVRVYKRAFTTPTRKLSYSNLFRINQNGNLVRMIIFQVYGRYRSMDWTTGMRYRPVDNAWDYYNNALGWTEILTGIQQDLHTWNRVYFETDLENGQYIAFETADQRINMQGIPILMMAGAGREQLVITVYMENEVMGSRADMSIDNIILKELGS